MIFFDIVLKLEKEGEQKGTKSSFLVSCVSIVHWKHQIFSLLVKK